MKKPGLIRKLIAGASEFLSPMGFVWEPDRNEFLADRNGYFDRVNCSIWCPYPRYISMHFYRHLPEVEIFRDLYGPVKDGFPDGKWSPTISTNPARIEQKTFDLFSYRPKYVKELNPDADATVLVDTLRDLMENQIFPMADKYSTLESLDEFLHHDIDQLPKLGMIGFYTTKGWLLEYRWLFAKSLYIAKKMNNPASKIIYDVCHALM